MAKEQHVCYRDWDFATLANEQKALKEIYSNDIHYMQKQLDEFNINIKELIKTINGFTDKLNDIEIMKAELKQAKTKLEELEKFKENINSKILAASVIVGIVSYLLIIWSNAWFTPFKW